MKISFLIAACAACHFVSGQNIGIGTSTPTEKLDVNGNINVSGTIKANGVDGQANQVLMKGSTGTLTWGDLSEYKNFETFKLATTSTWTVPAGVTKIFVEAWGGGGGGSGFGSGGGGGYISAYFTVVPGSSVSYTVGSNGTGGNNGSNLATSGTASTITVGSTIIAASGGIGSIIYDAIAPYGVYGASGGNYSVSSSFRNYRGTPGQDGSPNQLQYFQSNSTTYLEATLGGKGGDAGNTVYTGANGAYMLYTLTGSASLRYISTGSASQPGGGGGGNYMSGSYYGGSGADGMIIFHY